jgi:hypothetical protein
VLGTTEGGGGGFVPFQNKLRMFPEPHGSLAFPLHAMLQAEADALVVPGVNSLAQTAHPKAKRVWRKKHMNSWSLNQTKEVNTYSIGSKGS